MNLLLAAVLFLQDKTVEQLIENLRSDKIEVRNNAAVELTKRGEPVVPMLEKAAQDKNQEVARFAKEILKDIRDPLRNETAEETFNRMTEKLTGSKTLSVTLKVDFTRADKQPNFEAGRGFSLMMKGADKVRLTPIQKEKGGEEVLVSDGETVQGQKAWPPKVFRDDVLIGLTRVGVNLSLYIGGSIRMRQDLVVERRVEDRMIIKGIQLKGQDALGRIIGYEVTFGDREIVDVQVWCDLKTRLPRKRIASTRGEGQNLQHFSELYEDWILDAEIPDQKFKLPEKKK